MAFTFTIDTDATTGAPVAWINHNGNPVIRQPHHPDALLDPNDPTVGLWESEAAATAWAQEYVAQIEAEQAEAIAQAEAEAQAVAEDRARLERIEEMLTQLLAK